MILRAKRCNLKSISIKLIHGSIPLRKKCQNNPHLRAEKQFAFYFYNICHLMDKIIFSPVRGGFRIFLANQKESVLILEFPKV